MAIYFDNAATTPLDKAVLDEMLPFMNSGYGNPSSIHEKGRETRTAIERARKIIAGHINASPSEIFFTSCATESNNFAIRCAVKDLGIKHVISSRIEHHCVLYTVEEIGKAGMAEVHYIDVNEKGHFDLDQLDRTLAEINEPCLVSLMHANNEIGSMMDIDRAAAICQKYSAIFHSDTVQTMGHFPIDVQKTPVHMISGSGHKFHGPKGIGFVYITSEVKLKPLLYGGSQERNMRAGTENVYGIVGLGKAVDMAYADLQEESKHIQDIRDYLKEQLTQQIPGVSFNGDPEGSSLYTVLSVMFPPPREG